MTLTWLDYTVIAGYLVAITITLWDRHVSAASKVESTLWAVGVITLASLITLLLEVVFAAFKQSNQLIDGIAERLVCVEELLTHYVTEEAASASIQNCPLQLLFRPSPASSGYRQKQGSWPRDAPARHKPARSTDVRKALPDAV